MLKEELIDTVSSVGVRPDAVFRRGNHRFSNFYQSPSEDSMSMDDRLRVRSDLEELLSDVPNGTHADDPNLETVRLYFVTCENNAYQRGAAESIKQQCAERIRFVCNAKRS